MPRLTRRIDGESAAVARDELNNRLFFRVFQTANLYEAQVTRELTCSAVQGAVLGALSRDVEQGMSFSALYTYLAVSRQISTPFSKGWNRPPTSSASKGRRTGASKSSG
jgi:hypothetical protein